MHEIDIYLKFNDIALRARGQSMYFRLGSGATADVASAFLTCTRHASNLAIASQRRSARSAQQHDQPTIPDNEEPEDP
jgi:hypothetical protein